MKYGLKNAVAFLSVWMFCMSGMQAQERAGNVDPDGYNIIYHGNGKVASEGMMRGGKPDGYWKSYYPTGVLRTEGNRTNHLLDSTWVFYTQTGDTLEIINYRLGKRSGYNSIFETVTARNSVSRHYMKSKEMYLDDQREGTSYYYYPSGRLRQVISYRDGRKQGESREYDENGTVITIYRYLNDYMTSREFVNRFNMNGEKDGMWLAFYPDGRRMEEEMYRNGVLDGTNRTYSEGGTVLNERTYAEGRMIEDGVKMRAEAVDLISYYDDGVTIRRRGIYLDSIPVGYHYFYNSEGKAERAVRYSDRASGVATAEGPVDESERRTGEWKLYFETGELRSTGKYVNDRQDGEWTYYFQHGGTVQTGNFRSGVLEGAWKWFFPSGNLLREEVYAAGKPNGLSIQYSDSAEIVAQGEYLEGEREGPWIETIGDTREEGNYILGERDGMWRTYHRNGRLYHSGSFVQGNPDGRHIYYYPDGTVKEEQHYVMGRRDKNWKKYYENGGLFLTITYRNDEEIRINGMRID